MSWKSTIKLFADGHIYTEPDFVDNEGGSRKEALKIDADFNFNDDYESIDFKADSKMGQYLLKAIRFYEAYEHDDE